PVSSGYEKGILEQNCGEITESFTTHQTLASLKQNNDSRTITKSGIPTEFEKDMLERAVRRIQATFRGYQARRQFHTLKSIIRLQAIIHGHQEQKLIENAGGDHDHKPTSNYATDVPSWSEDDTEKPQRKQWKLPKSPLHLFSGLKVINPSEAIRAIEGKTSFSITEDEHRTLPMGDDPASYLGNHAVTDEQGNQFSLLNENNHSKEDEIGNENHKTKNIRSSLPTKHGDQVMGRHARKVESHTIATGPAKKGQASTWLGQDVAGNSVISRHFGEDVSNSSDMTRRHSLPSFDNGKTNAPPLVQWLRSPIEASGKGEQRLGKSASSSRGINGKNIRPQWKF
ncbi:hypothetical protein Leryth_021752, partial [Lithospermum erythrorhizon]